MDAVRKLICPGSVAVVGASPRVDSAGGAIIRTLDAVGFDGELYPVNPRYDEVLGRPCYDTLSALSTTPDAVFIGLPAAPSVGVLEEASRLGVRAAVIHASGYADAGREGARLQRELTRIARVGGIALSGPNNMGVLNVLDRTGMWTLPLPDARPGPVAIISQSGSAAIALSEDPKQLGLAYVLTSGNEAVLDISDYLEHVVADDRVRVVLLFIEAIRDPARFEALALQAAIAGKHLIAIKVGRSAGSQAMVRSHTNSIAGNDAMYEAFLRRCGVIRVADFDEMVELAALFVAWPERTARRGAVMLTMSGGEAALVADLASAADLPLPALPNAARHRVKKALGTFSLPRNPIDAWGRGWRGESFREAIEAIVSEGTPAVVAAVLDAPASGAGDSHIAREIAAIFGELQPTTTTRFVIVTTTTAAGIDADLVALAQERGIPCISGLRVGTEALARWFGHAPRRARGRGSRAPTAAIRAMRDVLEQREPAVDEGPELVRAAGVPMAPVTVVETAASAVRVAKKIGYPVVMKGHGEAMAHKSDLGLVEIGVGDDRTARATFAELHERLAAAGAADPTVTVAAQESGLELFVGVRNDPDFGVVTLAGLGGIGVEADGEVAVRIGGLNRSDVRQMLMETRAGQFLSGYRRQIAYDIDAAVSAVLALHAATAALVGVVDEIEVNPLIVRDAGRGAAGVDLVIVRTENPDLERGRDA